MVKKITLSKTAAKRLANAAKSKTRPGRNVKPKNRRSNVKPGRTRKIRQRNGRVTTIGGNSGKVSYVNAPVNVGRTSVNTGPGARTRSHPVCGREYYADVVGSTSFDSIPAIFWNAGDGTILPWLAKTASAYSMHRWKKLILEYRSTSSTANTGDILVSTVNDINVPLSTSKQQFIDQGHSNQSVPWVGFRHDVLKSGGTKYLREFFNADISGALPASISSDEHFYYPCFTQLATIGNVAAAVVGELWVEYEVEFLEPRITPLLGVLNETNFVDSLIYYCFVGITSTFPLGTFSSSSNKASRYVGTPSFTTGVWTVYYSSGNTVLFYNGDGDPNNSFERYFRVTLSVIGTGLASPQKAALPSSNMFACSLGTASFWGVNGSTSAASTQMFKFPANFDSGSVPYVDLRFPVATFTAVNYVTLDVVEVPFPFITYGESGKLAPAKITRRPGRNSQEWRDTVGKTTQQIHLDYEASRQKLLQTINQRASDIKDDYSVTDERSSDTKDGYSVKIPDMPVRPGFSSGRCINIEQVAGIPLATVNPQRVKKTLALGKGGYRVEEHPSPGWEDVVVETKQ